MDIALTHAGRILLALYLLAPGIMKFTAWEMHITLMETHGMPIAAVLLALAGIIQVGASICLLLNKQVVVCALGLAIMVLLINVSLHDFWNVYEDVNAERETQNFFKNLGIFAGLLLLAGTGMPQQGRNKITNV